MGTCVVAVDIGAVGPPSKFAWARFNAPDREAAAAGDNPQSAVSELAADLANGEQAVLVLEAPMSVPVPTGHGAAWRMLGKARSGEGNRPWSAGAGGTVLATGLAQGAWMLGQLAEALPSLAATTQPSTWQRRAAPLLLGEAFVSAAGKPLPLPAGQHAADAAAAGRAVVELLDDAQPLTSSVYCSPQGSFNLLAAMGLWAGLHMDPGELRREVLVIAARPEPRAFNT
jgi:hypothetical protein